MKTLQVHVVYPKDPFALTDEDKETLKRYGHDPRDFEQIEQCANKSVYVLDYKESVPIEKALELLGRETFLSGISRSAFHWTAARETPDGKHSVHFESGTCSPFREKV